MTDAADGARAGAEPPLAGPAAQSGPPARQSADEQPGEGELSVPAAAAPAPQQEAQELPLRVSTLEIFFDLVFAFTLTQLTAVLATRLSWLSVAQVLLVFSLLWWMYGAYAWLTNSRPPVHTVERLLLLIGMAGFLVVGLAIPRGFADYGVVLGVGYLAVVVVHTILYYRANPNILRVAPFNVGSALLVIAAGFLHGPAAGDGPAAYLLWVLAVAVQLGSPLIVHPQAHFALRPAHFCERHGALLIVAIGESVAAVGIGAAGPASRAGAVSWRLLAGAVLGLAVAAALWWIVFGAGDQERAEQVLSQATVERRTALALNAFFYGNIPLLLGLIATAAAILRAVVLAAGSTGQGSGLPARAGQAAVLACGAALFLAGEVIVRRTLGIAPVRPRAVAAVIALPTVAVGIAAGLIPQLVLVAAVLVAPLVAERWATAGRAADLAADLAVGRAADGAAGRPGGEAAAGGDAAG
jgi:low temperature requirement protein LtrA